MDEFQEIVEKRKRKLKDALFGWVKDNYDKTFLVILGMALIIRLYYFFLTMNQPLWWDEACYGSLAANLVSHLWDNTQLIRGETLIRPILFPFFWSILMRLHIPETGVRFLLEFIPSILSVFFVYLTTKELYNKRIALMSSFVFSVFWIHLFYSSRLLTNIPALLFLFSSIYYFVKSTKNNFIPKYFSISLILLSISTLMRYPNGLIFFAYLFMLIIGKKLLIKDKKFWISGIIGLTPILLFFLFNFIASGNIFPALFGGGYLTPAEIDGQSAPPAWGFLHNIPIYLSTFSILQLPSISFIALLKSIFFIFFLIGFGIALLELVLGYNLIIKNKRIMAHLLLFLVLISIYSFFIFYLKGAEDRYFFPTSITLAAFTALGMDYFYKFIKKLKGKNLAITVVIVILFIGAYTQITFADQLIKNRQQSFLQIRQGFEWFAKNTPETTVVAGTGIEPYAVYYARNQQLAIPLNRSEEDKILEADYLVYHFFTPQQDYIPDYLTKNQDKWEVVNAFFFDYQNQQPAFVIYKRK